MRNTPMITTPGAMNAPPEAPSRPRMLLLPVDPFCRGLLGRRGGTRRPRPIRGSAVRFVQRRLQRGLERLEHLLRVATGEARQLRVEVGDGRGSTGEVDRAHRVVVA